MCYFVAMYLTATGAPASHPWATDKATPTWPHSQTGSDAESRTRMWAYFYFEILLISFFFIIPVSTPEAVHNISQSVHRAASKTADIGKPMRSKIPVLCPVSNKQPTQKALHKCAKLKKAIPSTTHDSLANTPKLSSSRFVKPPARSLAKDPVRTNPAKSLPSSTVYDKLADQVWHNDRFVKLMF